MTYHVFFVLRSSHLLENMISLRMNDIWSVMTGVTTHCSLLTPLRVAIEHVHGQRGHMVLIQNGHSLRCHSGIARHAALLQRKGGEATFTCGRRSCLAKRGTKVFQISKVPAWVDFDDLRFEFKLQWKWEIELVKTAGRFATKTFIV